MKSPLINFVKGFGVEQVALCLYALLCWACVGTPFVTEDLDLLNFSLVTQNMTNRRQLLQRLKKEVAALEEAVTIAGQNGDVRGARPPVLSSVVDVDYFLRKLALSFGITTEDRRLMTEEKARARKH